MNFHVDKSVRLVCLGLSYYFTAVKVCIVNHTQIKDNVLDLRPRSSRYLGTQLNTFDDLGPTV